MQQRVAGAVVSAPRKVTCVSWPASATSEGQLRRPPPTSPRPRTVAKVPKTVARGGQDSVRKAAHSAKKTTGDVRKAVKDSRPGNTGEKNSAEKEDTE
jgi:hypothetical protein